MIPRLSLLILFIAAGGLAAQDRPETTSALDVGSRKQLFVDDLIVEKLTRLDRVLGRVEKQNEGKPIFTDGWFYGTVLHQEDRFKLWWRKPGTQGFAYAESDDGIHFHQIADLTGIKFAGDYTLAVEFDPHETDPAHRFKAAFDAPGMAAGIAHSRNGIAWTPYHDGKPVTGRAADTYNQILWDELAQTYRLFTRTDFGTAGGNTELRGTRSLTNPDPKSHPADWKPVRAWKFDKMGPKEADRRQIYAATCWIYEGVYFALLSVYEFPGDAGEGTATDHVRRHEKDVMNFYLATSRDGDAWDFRWVYAEQPLIPRGPDRAFDKDLILPASTIVTHADRHWLYYAGGNERHGTEKIRFERDHAIGLATLRLDGFVALAAGDEPGTLHTKPLRWAGENLALNVDASAGEIQIELLDESGQALPGFHATATKVDDIRWRPEWKAQRKLAELQGRTIQLNVTLRNAQLYSLKFE